VARANQTAGFLTLFYVFALGLIFMAAFPLLRSLKGSRKEPTGSLPAIIAVIILFGFSFFAISRSNMSIIQADIIYKRGKPFDQNASRQNQPLETRNANWDVAIAIYEDAIAKAPLEDFYYLFIGRAYLEKASLTADPVAQQETINKADQRLKRAQDINPLNTDHTANLARLYTRSIQLSQNAEERQAKLDTAINYYHEALSLSPQNSVIRNELANLLLQVKQDCPGSLAVFQESLDIDPYYDATYVQFSNALNQCADQVTEEEQQEYMNLSADALEDALAIDDRSVANWYRLADTRITLKDYEGALVALNETRARNSNNSVFPWLLDYATALAYQGLEETGTALQYAEQALQAAPPEQAGQIQVLVGQLSNGTVENGDAILFGDERPLAQLAPAERNNYYNAYPPFVIDLTKQYEVVMTTNKGVMRFRLFDDSAPLTVNNFAFLASQGFYDGLPFHRVIEGFMAQTGDPLATGAGGPGYQFEDEILDTLTFDKRGYLAMANAGPATNGSQFFITFVPTPHLNGLHTIFGDLIEGDDVLSSLQLRDPSDPSAPADVIEKIEIVEVQ
jgi:cyclophilin family peptidyl-prolyl cis-trans isomerase/predicted Zn-dependent protease